MKHQPGTGVNREPVWPLRSGGDIVAAPMDPDSLQAANALGAWGIRGRIVPVGGGLINRTWRVDADNGRRYALQRVNPIFPPEVQEDIAAVTAHLRARGMFTPELVPAAGGALCQPADPGTWRVLTWVDGTTRDALDNPAQAREAGALLARFHAATADLRWRFRNPRPGVHDIDRHLAGLREALHSHAAHPRHARIEPLARAILAASADLPALPRTPERVVHGDPKISNLIFDARTGAGLCMVDLDTLAYMRLPLELGDAFRSWCNTSGEDSTAGRFDLDLFAGAVSGYAAVAAPFVTAQEYEAFVPATLTIFVELAARFCADALAETYFGWDAGRYATRGEHNEVRAAGQLAAARALQAVAARAGAIVRDAFSAAR
ncbi:MAG: phosphotransferase enzyme family protein [Gammaproteobacteria bacterium]